MSSKEGTRSVEPPEAHKEAPKVGEGSGSAAASPSLRRAFQLFKEVMVEELGFDNVKALITLVGLLSSLVEDMVVRCLCIKVALFQSLWYSLEVGPRHTVYCCFSLLLFATLNDLLVFSRLSSMQPKLLASIGSYKIMLPKPSKITSHQRVSRQCRTKRTLWQPNWPR